MGCGGRRLGVDVPGARDFSFGRWRGCRQLRR